MKKMQIKKLVSHIAGIELSGAGEQWNISTQNETQKKKVCAALRKEKVSVGGYRCGHGGWELKPGYQADSADYCDKSSRHHY